MKLVIDVTANVEGEDLDLGQIQRAVNWHAEGLRLALALPDSKREVHVVTAVSEAGCPGA